MKQYKLPKGFTKTNFYTRDIRTLEGLLNMLNNGNTLVKFVVLYPGGVSKIYELSNVTNFTTTMKKVKKVNKLKKAVTAKAKKVLKKKK